MKTLLISPMWLDSKTEDSMKRVTKWLHFMIPLQKKLGVTDILLIDNASSPEKIEYIEKNYPVNVIRNHVHIPRNGHLKYGYWYAALAQGSKYALDNGYDKLVYIDTDFYPLSDMMCEYTKESKGWVGLYCHKHNFPETCYQIVVGRMHIQNFHDFHSRDFLRFYPDLDAESQTPFTHVEKGFKGDRYGEQGIPQDETMDYYGQSTPDQTLVFNMGNK